VQGPDGNFYGTTAYRGSGDYGAVFKVTTEGGLTTLINFTFPNESGPQASLTLGSDDNGKFSHIDAGAASNNSRFYHVSVP